MSAYRLHSLKEFATLFAKHQAARERRIKVGLQKAAVDGRGVVKRAVPVAFGELRESVHREGSKVVVDAPYAAAVERGSRPHWMPLEPLIQWVKLRGVQGLLEDRQIGRLPGPTTADHARSVAAQIAAMSHRGPREYTRVDVPTQIAKMIQRAIAAHGTKPHWYARTSVPEISRIALAYIREAMPEKA